ncbi:MAG: heme exporter protein CcmB [Rhodospirillales bacterium 20-60-12]|jgi:heme exporter protein B|nr:MAG: heme exporter protein CcmB [Rhodospirillales bacterium 20-60-12]HQT66391.1 heme exporter protein CcmB [Acetobacteraceae bacterium]HQU02968.1 heme exporter protein CcmB [Acetobacteraceae bacterium]
MNAFRALLTRELRLALRHAGDSMAALLFFIIAGTMFPFALGPAPSTLAVIAPGVVWVCALLAALLPLDRLFSADFEDGSLDQLLLSGLPASAIALAKMIAHWLTTGLPLLLISGPLAIMLRADVAHVPALLLSLLPGTLILSLFGGLGAAITLGARRSTILLPLITLPLTIPVLIFGAAAATSQHPKAEFLLLAAILAFTVPLAPLAAAAALRAAAE